MRTRTAGWSRLIMAAITTSGLLVACSTSTGGGGTASPTTGVIVPASASQVGPPTAAPATATPAPAGTASAAAWCAFVIEINTKYGYMTNKNYSATPPSLDVERQIVTEALSRLDEWKAISPPEIKDATVAEITYFQALKAYGDVNGWTSAAGFPQPTTAQATLIASLVPYQQTQCGITFGK